MNIMNQFVLRNLKKNKVRTFVTILGIILATSLFMAVTEGMISFVKFLADWTMETDGAWEVEAMKVPGEKAEELRKVDGVKDSMVMQVLGFHELDEIKNPNKPYLTVMQLEKNYKEFLPGFKLYEGRMAENEHELVVPKHLMDSGGLDVGVGDTVTLETGNRYYKKENISSEALAVDEDRTLAEELGDLKSRTYQIVGICAKTTMESKLPEPGYYAFTIGRETGSFSEVYLKAKEPKKAAELVDKIFQQMKSAGESGMVATINDKLLLYRGEGTSSEAKRLTGMLVALVTILIGIVMAASVSMIHDAFAISVSERTKMYGLLKSIGATKRQIRDSVFFEAMVLCVIGIPVGLLCGILGTDLGLRYAGMLFKKILSVPVDTTLHLVFSPAAAFLSAGIGILTILLSAMLPAVRAIHMPAIEALRQSRDIKTERTFGRKQRNVKEKRSSLSKLSYRLFGFSGALAGKNFKRNRKRQRSIVVALTTSVILLVTSVSFCDYLAKMVNAKEEKASYDVYLYLTSGPVSGGKLFQEKEALDKVSKQLFNDVEDVSYSRMLDGMLLLHRDELTGDCMEQQLTALQKKGEQVLMNVRVVFVEDEGYRRFLRKHHLDEEKYMNPEKLCPLFNDSYHFYDMEKENTSLGSYFKKDSFSGKLYLLPDEKDGYTYTQEVTLKKDGSVSLGYETEGTKKDYDYVHYDMTDEGGEETVYMKGREYSLEDAGFSIDMAGNQRFDGKNPLGASEEEGKMQLLLPYSALRMLPEEFKVAEQTLFGIQSEKHLQVDEMLAVEREELTDILRKSGVGVDTVESGDRRAASESREAVFALVRFLSLGFLGIVGIIILADVFNTISTSISLRRQEFAMLSSVGMSKRELRRLMDYECLIYGVKGLLYGLPVAFGLVRLMYEQLKAGYTFGFYIPVYGIVAAVLLAFVIVFFSMLYAMNKLKAENPMETLRNEVI